MQTVSIAFALISSLSQLPAEAPANTPAAPAAPTVPARLHATETRTLLRNRSIPGKVRRAVTRGNAELWRVDARLVIRPSDRWLAAAEARPATLVVSDDGGRTWRTLDLPQCGNAGCRLRLERGGTWQHLTGFEAPCGGGGQSRTAGVLATGESFAAPWPWDSPLDFDLPADGWAAGRCFPKQHGRDDWTGPDEVPCLVDLAGRIVFLPVALEPGRDFAVQIDQAAGLATYAGKTLRLADAPTAPPPAPEPVNGP